jgi:hypothetical protein
MLPELTIEPSKQAVLLAFGICSGALHALGMQKNEDGVKKDLSQCNLLSLGV